MDNPEQIIRLLSEVEPDDREELIFYITAYPYTGDEEEIERFEQAMYGFKGDFGRPKISRYTKHVY